MALDKQKIALPIVDGLDTKGDDKTILPTRFLELENVDFTNPGSLRKRNGYEALSNHTLEGDRIETGSALTSLKDELLQYSNNRLFSYSEGESAWEDKGEIRFCSAFSKQISADNAILKNPSFYSYGGISCYAYEKEVAVISRDFSVGPDVYDILNHIEIVIIDDKSSAILAKYEIGAKTFYGGVAEGNIVAPKVGFVGSKFVIFYYIVKNAGNQVSGNATGLTFSSIDFLNPKTITHQITAPSTPTLLPASAAITTYFKYDIVSINSRCFFAHYSKSAADVVINYLDASLTLGTAQSTGFNVDVHNISLNKEGAYLRVFISSTAGTTAKTYLYTFNLNSQVHPELLIPIAVPASSNAKGVKFFPGAGIFSISGAEDPTNSSRSIFVWQAKPVVSEAGYLMSATVDANGVYTLVANPLFAGAELQSKVAVYGDYAYFYVSKNVNSSQVSGVIDPAQPTYLNTVNKPVRTVFLVKALVYNSEISAKFEVDAHVYVDASYKSGLPNVDVSATGLRVPCSSINGLQPVNATTLLAPAVIKVLISDFSQSLNYFDATQGDSLYISGGLLKQYDGFEVVEQGFLDTPEPIKALNDTDFVAGNGLVGGQVYYYIVVYKWTDRTGKVHYSAPSRAVEKTVPGTGEHRALVTFTPLYFTNKENVEIEIYRTTGNGSVYYKVSHVVDDTAGVNYLTGGYPNDKGMQSLSIVDDVTDAELQFSEPLYTTGGVLENDAPEASDYVTTYKSRLFLILSDGHTLQYSKVTGIGDPVRFNAAQKIPMDNFGGRAKCAIAMDDHLIIFKERAIYALTGEGPNDLGQQDDYRTPYLITSDAGCIDPNSLVNNPNGVMFKSAKGIYMLKRNFTLQYIGDSVEKYNDEVINSATLHPTLNQIRLITTAGRALVYDYYCNRWSTYTNMYGLDSIEFRGSYYFIKADGLVMKETVGSYLDSGQYIKMRIKSAWIQLGGVQGFQRLYSLMMLGNYHSAHNLKVSLCYNFNPYYTQDVIIDTSSVISESVYGTGSYGSESLYGGAFPLYQFQINPKIQKCQSFQFELQDFRTTDDGAAFSLSHLVAQVGIKRGTEKKGTANKFATA